METQGHKVRLSLVANVNTKAQLSSQRRQEIFYSGAKYE